MNCYPCPPHCYSPCYSPYFFEPYLPPPFPTPHPSPKPSAKSHKPKKKSETHKTLRVYVNIRERGAPNFATLLSKDIQLHVSEHTRLERIFEIAQRHSHRLRQYKLCDRVLATDRDYDQFFNLCLTARLKHEYRHHFRHLVFVAEPLKKPSVAENKPRNNTLVRSKSASAGLYRYCAPRSPQLDCCYCDWCCY